MANNLLINNLSFLFSHIEKWITPSPYYIEHTPKIKVHFLWNPPQKSRILISLCPPLLCFYFCFYLIFYFFTHHTQSKPSRLGALPEKEVSTISLLCVYAYVYFYIILYIRLHLRYIRLYIRYYSRYYFLIYCVLKIWKLFIQDIFE